MSPSLIILVACVATAVGSGVPAARYPAGVDPHACPNYPYCDNAALAAGHHGAAATSTPIYSAYGHHGAIAHGDVAKYPAGVSPHSCPNYPYCGPAPVHVYAGPYGLAGVVNRGWSGAGYTAPIWSHGVSTAHHGAGARYPAGLNPHSCPNYPYCHH